MGTNSKGNGRRGCKENQELKNHCIRHRAPKFWQPEVSEETSKRKSGKNDTVGDRKRIPYSNFRRRTATTGDRDETSHLAE